MPLERERDQAPTPCKATEKKRLQLMSLNGIGPAIAAVMTHEVYYRQFDNRRQVAGFLGLATSPHDSGDVERSQGISRAGRGQVRGTMIQAARLWLKHQPKSAITRWFVQRTAGPSGRIRRIMIIAVARKWRSRCGASLNRASCRKVPCSPTGNDTGGESSTVPTLLRVGRAGRRCGCYGDSQIWLRLSAVPKMSPVLPARSSMHAAEWQAGTELPDIS